MRQLHVKFCLLKLIHLGSSLKLGGGEERMVRHHVLTPIGIGFVFVYLGLSWKGFHFAWGPEYFSIRLDFWQWSAGVTMGDLRRCSPVWADSHLWLPTDTAMKGNIILGSSWVLSITTESSGTTQKNFKWGLEAALRVIEVTLPYYLDFISSCVEEEVAWSPRRAWKCCQPWMWELFQSRAPWAWDLHFLG